MSIISNYRNQSKQGLTLIEVLIGITIFGVLIAAVFGIYQTIQAGNNANEAGRNIQTIFNSSSKIFRREQTTGLDTGSAISLGIFPESMNIDNTAGVVYNLFDGETKLVAAGNNGWTLTYPLVTAGETCVSIIQSQIGVGWDTADVNTTEIDLLGQDSSGAIVIGSACDTGEDTVDLTFFKTD